MNANQKTIQRDRTHHDDRTTTRTHEQQNVSQRTRGEHDELLIAMHKLEGALGSPAPGRESNWARRVIGDLASVSIALRAHVASAEGETGLFSELLLVRPEMTVARIERLRIEHGQLLEQAAALAGSLGQDDCVPDFAALRRQAAELLAAIRTHHAHESDLIFECFWTDIGCGD